MLQTASISRLTGRLALVGVLAVAVPACSGVRSALGVDKSPPDEFAVVTKAPLIVRPDFSLRTPRPGAPRPQEVQPTESARMALVGQDGAEADAPSAGEMALLRNARADRTDPNIRAVLNDESGRIREKDEAFADAVIFAKPGEVTGANTDLEVPTEEEKQAGTLDSSSTDPDNDSGIDEILDLLDGPTDVFE